MSYGLCNHFNQRKFAEKISIFAPFKKNNDRIPAYYV